jgi:hypothetical protein
VEGNDEKQEDVPAWTSFDFRLKSGERGLIYSGK